MHKKLSRLTEGAFDRVVVKAYNWKSETKHNSKEAWRRTWLHCYVFFARVNFCDPNPILMESVERGILNYGSPPHPCILCMNCAGTNESTTGFCASLSLLFDTMLRLPLVVVLFWSEKFTPCEGSEVDTSLVTLQGSSCCLTCCWCVAQDTTVILRATWMLGYASRHETVILRAVWSTRGTLSSSTKCAEHRLTFVVVPSRMYHMIFIPLLNCLDTYTRTVTRWNVRTLYKPYQIRWLIIARAHNSDMPRGTRFTENVALDCHHHKKWNC